MLVPILFCIAATRAPPRYVLIYGAVYAANAVTYFTGYLFFHNPAPAPIELAMFTLRYLGTPFSNDLLAAGLIGTFGLALARRCVHPDRAAVAQGCNT